MKVKALIVAIVMIMGVSYKCHSRESGNPASLLDSTRWFACIDKSDCQKLSGGFKSKLKKTYNEEYAIAASLSALLAEYLREEGAPLDMAVIDSALVRCHSDPEQGEGEESPVNAFTHLIMQNNKEAREAIAAMTGEDEKSISARLIMALSYRDNPSEFIRYAAELLKTETVPFLTLELGRRMVERGLCRPAIEYFDRLMKNYNHNGTVVSSWAAAKMDCGDYSGKVYSSLRRIYKDSPKDYNIVAGMIRCLNHKKDFKEIKRITDQIDVERLSGDAGSDLLTEWGRFELEKNRTVRAESLLKRAITLDPKNIEAHRLLGRLYMVDKKDIPKAIASLKSYVYLAPDIPDTEKMRILISDMEKTAR